VHSGGGSSQTSAIQTGVFSWSLVASAASLVQPPGGRQRPTQKSPGNVLPYLCFHRQVFAFPCLQILCPVVFVLI
jgi:hypothetical protein